MPSPLPFLFPDQFVQRHNTAWRVEPGRRDPFEPLISPLYPWDSGAVFSHGTALFDPVDRRFKLWHISNPAGTHDRRLTYAESEDGVRWVRPKLDICPYSEEYPRTNILLDFESGGNCSYASVFIDPEAEPANRYEMFLMRYAQRGRKMVIRGLPLPPRREDHPYGMYRYRSADGLHWQPVEGPVILGGEYPHGTADTCFIYREPDGSYVAYHKTELASFPGGLVPYDIGRGACRMAARRTSPDGAHWSDPLIVMTPDWRDAHDTQIMEVLPLRVPGGLVAVVTVYHGLNQTIDLQFAASRDGITWWRPDRRPCLANDPLGDYCGGMIWPTRTLVENDGQYHLYFAGLDGIHGDIADTEPAEQIRAAGLPYRDFRLHGELTSIRPSSIPFHGGIHRATWTVGRLWAIVPAAGGPSEATLTTLPQECAGRRLAVDAVTVGDGELAAELLDGEGKPWPGFGRDDCVVFRGDAGHATLRWRGGDVPPATQSSIRFYLQRARLYGFAFVAA